VEHDGWPVIVMGMHRSGTSLITRVLRAGGVDMGADGNVHDESDFFRELNKEIFRAGHADWDWPLALVPALEDAALCTSLVERLREACSSKEARGFAGRRFGRVDLLSRGDPWGWKDPRNTCTLPLWLETFPHARVVNVYRDGVDVAASLVTRERKRAGRLANAIRSSRCLVPQRAFEVWTEYMEMNLRVTADLEPERVRDVRYERLIEKPESTIRELFHFIDREVDDAAVAALVAEIQGHDASPWRGDPEWVALRREVSDHQLMQRLEYGPRR
jgi:hypothetical protein